METETLLISFIFVFFYWLGFKGSQYIFNRSYEKGSSFEQFDLWVTVIPIVNVVFALLVYLLNFFEIIFDKEAQKYVATIIFKKLKK